MRPLQTETVYSTPWFDVVAKTMRPAERPYYSLRLPDYVGVLALTEDQRILAVRQYRPAIEEFTIELPAGLVDPGEAPVAAGRRELLEETGYRAEEMQVLGALSTDSGRLSNRIWACFAKDVRREPNHSPEADVEALTYSVEDFLEITRQGQFHLSLHVAIVMLAAARGLIRFF